MRWWSRSSRRSRRSSSRSSAISGRRPTRTKSTRRWPHAGRSCSTRRRSGCARCHGVYDGRGNVEWPGVHKDVGTDRARLDVVSDKFIDAFRQSPLAAEGALVKSRGYAATPLTGVWANYPYLHNGSVPTLYHLLGPASERPAIFHVMAAGRFDRTRVGQLLYLDPAPRPARRGRAPAPLRRRSRLVQHGAPGIRQRRPRRLVADSHGREPPRADRVPEDALGRL